EENAAVPGVVSGGNKLLRMGAIRLLREALNATNRNAADRLDCGPQFDVSVSGLGPGWWNSEHNDALAAGRQDDAGLHHLCESRGILHHVVGGEYANDRIRRVALQQKCCQSACGSSVTRCRFTENIALRHFGEL